MNKHYFSFGSPLLILFLLLFAGNAFSQIVLTYNSPNGPTGTAWVCPMGVTSVQVETWGAGGGGGFARGQNGSAGGGGGGGGYSLLSVPVVPGNTYYFIVGAGGVGGLVDGTQGTAGGQSSFATGPSGTGILTFANGGNRGNGGAVNSAALAGAGGAGGAGNLFTGGNGASGTVGNNAAGGGGGGGGGASTTSAGLNATGKTGGIGGTVGGGNGGNGVSGSAGNIGAVIGGGGSGAHRTTASNNQNGSAGASGQVRITYATPPCFAPAQATGFTLGTPTSTTLPATFSGTASGYLVVRSLTNTPPSQPVNGVTYSAANVGTLGAGFTFVQTGASTSIAGPGLVGNTRYYYFIYAYNSALCLGGPTYATGGALTGNGVTCPAVPNTVSTSAVGVNSFTLNWTAPTGGSASAITYTIQITTDPGYTANIPGSPFTVAAPTVTRNFTGLSTTTTYYYRIMASNGCSSSYVSGSVTTVGSYCASTSTGTTFYIDSFSTTGGILNITNNTSGLSPTGYGNFMAMSVSQNAGLNINFSAAFYDGIFNTYGFNIWVDWNNDADFADAGEKVYGSGAYVVSASGSFNVPVATPPGGYRMRIRADYFSTNPAACGSITNGETEDYTLLVASPLPCSGNPTNLSANIITATSVTLSWTDAIPFPANGYQYYFSTSATNPIASTTPSGVVAAGLTSVTISPLTAGIRYYYWVRSDCAGALGQGSWMGPQSFIIPTCGIGNSTGTTTLGCHNVVSGGLGLNGADVPAINCVSGGCVTLEATYLNVGAPTNYTVAPITYAPPYQFHCLKNPVSVNDDDVWSPVVNLPFNFCFYGTNYSQCLISSNGAITFDMTSNTPGGTSAWQFTTGLPSASLFRNAIFGVYHDIDPRVGGEVGWELITLNTGCRALVAAWHDIPMYSAACNSQLYTGMMVLYENTNVIDVFIEQKNVCGTWNDGNAIVGIQNATGTAAVVPPGRNGLDANWSVTNEAWRFTPSGPSTATVKWYQGSGNTGPVVGTTNTISVCPSSTTTYTAEITYNLCNSSRTVVISDETTVNVNSNKTWNGSVSTDWNTAANWTPSGVPTNLQCVLIPSTPQNCVISGSAYNAYAHNITVQNGGVLRIQPTNNNLTVTDAVNVNTGGQFNIMNSAGLIQVNNVPNVGTINMTRISQPMYRYDYTYWGSPVTLGSNYTLGMLSPNTLSDKFFSWIPFVGNSFGTWQQESVATIMDPLKGYIVRAPQSFSLNPAVKAPYTAVFTGVPNNGTLNAPVLYGTMGGPTFNDQYNLLANPYPSSISAASFLNLANNASTIDGTIYFWTHNSAISTAYPDPFYNDYLYNYTASDYASWNKVGGVGTAASTGGSAPNGYIGAGQSFFVRSLNVPGGAIFNNSMRAAAYSNSQFFRPGESSSETVQNEEDFEKHRLWLNMMNPGSFSQILVAYAEGATNDWERGYDGHRFEHLESNSLYSMIGDEVFVIQARALPLDQNDQVPLGFNSLNSGEYTIRIDRYEGDFENHNIYIEDKLLNVIHNLKESPYTFTTAPGHFEDRLVLRYTDSSLGNTDFSTSGLSAFIDARKFYATATDAIESIDVYEVNGKLVKTYQPLAKSKSFEDDFIFSQGVYFAKVKLANGSIVTQKLMNR